MTTNKQEYNKRHGKPKDATNTKSDIAKQSKIPKKVLDTVYDRGFQAYFTNYSSVREKATGKKGTMAAPTKKMSPHRWAHARVLSFANKIEGPRRLNHDRDLLSSIPRLRDKNILGI